MEKQNYDIEEIKKTLSIIKPNNALYEIRILKDKITYSGYFKGTDNLEKELNKLDLRSGNVNMFYTLQVIDEACYSREQHECFKQSPKLTTSDADIKLYNWLLIDLDPKRRSGVSSSEDELVYTKKKAEQIAWYLKGNGFHSPIIALSGNGVHFLYGISLSNTPENSQLVEKCLKALSYLFSDEKVDIDVKVFNPARISKLYGSVAQKGANTKERPHRMSRIVKCPEQIELTPKEILMKLASFLPEEETRPVNKRQKQVNEFDLDAWISEHGIRVQKITHWNDCTKYTLCECAFDPSHKAPDACILKMPSGAIAYKCLHNSCAGRTWQDFRLLYEPDAYDEKQQDDHIERGYEEYKKYNRNREDITYQLLEKETPEEPLFESAKHIINKKKEERICIETGFKEIDRLTGGLAKGEISVVSGLRGAGKSTWLSQVILNCIEKEHTAIVYSGELKDTRFMDWISLQAAGDGYILSRQGMFGNIIYYILNKTRDMIADWMDSKLWLYNNRFGSSFKDIGKVLASKIKETQADMVLIDNMMSLDLSEQDPFLRNDKYEQQTLFVKQLKDIAVSCNCHIIFVAHPRKAQGFLRLDDIAGSGNISNLVDNAFICHRVNEDFTRLTKQMYHWKDDNSIYAGDNVIEICKDRENGTQDKFIPMYYQQSSRRFLSTPNEEIKYSWQLKVLESGEEDKAGFIPVDTAGVDMPF